MTLFSYAQNFEDIRLWRAFVDIGAGRYLDIGTQDPVQDSVSLLFYQIGWRGVHVEPTPTYAAAMRAARPDEPVIGAAVATSPAPITLFEFPNTGLSTGVREIADGHQEAGFPCREITVPTITLADLFDYMGDQFIHWMKIDVEGMESDVLASWGDHPARPAALVIEATAPTTQRPTHLAWQQLVLQRGYSEVLFDGLSRYYIHKDHAERGDALALAPNVFDGFQLPSSHFAVGELNRQCDAALEAEKSNCAALREADADCAAQQQAERAAQLEQAARELEAAKSQHAAELDAARQNLARLDQDLAVAGEKLAQAHAAGTARSERHSRELAAAADRHKALDSEHRALQREHGRLEGQHAELSASHAEVTRAAEAARHSLEGQLDLARRALTDAQVQSATLRGDLKLQDSRHSAILAAAEVSHQVDMANAQTRIEAMAHAADSQAEQLTALMNESDRIRQHASAMDRRLHDAVHLMEDAPDLMTGLAPLSQSIIRTVLGKHRLAMIDNHRAALTAWRSAPALTAVHFDAGAADNPVDADTTLGNRTRMTEGSQIMHSEGPINTVPKLLAPHDREFIFTAYRSVLGRDPEPDGEAYYLARLRTGTHKLAILKQLRRSAEGRTFVPGVAGLDRAIKRYRWATMPVMGWIMRLFTGDDGNSARARHSRVLINEIGRMSAGQKTIAASVNALEGNLALIETMIGSLQSSERPESAKAEFPESASNDPEQELSGEYNVPLAATIGAKSRRDRINGLIAQHITRQ